MVREIPNILSTISIAQFSIPLVATTRKERKIFLPTRDSSYHAKEPVETFLIPKSFEAIHGSLRPFLISRQLEKPILEQIYTFEIGALNSHDMNRRLLFN